jgi:MFS family permease
MSEQSPSEHTTANRSKFFYGWVIVAVCTLMVAISYGLMYSFSVFFKPLADYFDWDRSTVSLIYSASLIIRGFMAIVVGWLADRYGSIKITVFCGIMIGLGLILSSQTHALWQFFIAYGVIEAIGLSGAFGIGTGITSRWFVKNRGLALGFVASGSGLGTFIIVPGNERLIAAFGWSQAFIICGIIAGLVMASTAFLLRPPSVKSALLTNKKPGSLAVDSEHTAAPHDEITFGQTIKDSRMILFLASALLFFFQHPDDNRSSG